MKWVGTYFRARRMAVIMTVGVVMLSAGCHKHGIKVVVKPDGSGHILLTRVALAGNYSEPALAGSRPFFSPGRGRLFSPYLNAKAPAALAALFGPSVQFTESIDIVRPDARGIIALYTFTDINDVSIPLSPRLHVQDILDGGRIREVESDELAGGDRIEFRMEPTNGPRRLTILLPEPITTTNAVEVETNTTVEAEGTHDGPLADGAPKMATQIGDLSLDIDVEFTGQILAHTAATGTFASNTITLLHAKLGDMLRTAPAELQTRAGSVLSFYQSDLSEVAPFLNAMPGLIHQTNREVQVEFATP